MARISRATLKSKFKTGKRPTQQDFEDWLDSFLHKDEQQAVNSQAFNQRLSQYDQDLRAITQNGTVDTLGDLLSLFQGWPEATKLVNAIASAGQPQWANVQGKPTLVAVQWSEQIVSTDGVAFNPFSQAGVFSQTRWLVSEVGALANAAAVVVMDMQVTRRFAGSGVDTGYYIDSIQKLRLAVSPRVRISS